MWLMCFEVLRKSRFALTGSWIYFTIERGAGLLGDSFFDRLDAYVVVKLGAGRETRSGRKTQSGRTDPLEFRTPTQLDKGPDPEFNASGELAYRGEAGLELYVYSEDTTSDDLIGFGFLPEGKFLTAPFRGEMPLVRSAGSSPHSSFFPSSVGR